MKRLTLKEMTQAQLQRVKTRLAQAEKNQDKPLTNSETNRIKNEVIDEIMKEIEKEAKKVRAQKKKDKLMPSEETFTWSANHPRRKG